MRGYVWKGLNFSSVWELKFCPICMLGFQCFGGLPELCKQCFSGVQLLSGAVLCQSVKQLPQIQLRDHLLPECFSLSATDQGM